MLTSLKFQINEQHNLKLGIEPWVRKTKCSHWLGTQDWFMTKAINSLSFRLKANISHYFCNYNFIYCEELDNDCKGYWIAQKNDV